MNKSSVLKTFSRVILYSLFILMTLHTLNDLQQMFGVEINTLYMLIASLVSTIPATFIFIILYISNKKTEYLNSFVVKNIRFVFRMTIYSLIFLTFVLWTFLLIFISANVMMPNLTVASIRNFALFRILYSIISAIITILLFYGLSRENR
jgi:uncharacterized membrane protein